MRDKVINIDSSNVCVSKLQAACSRPGESKGVTEVVRGWGNIKIEADCANGFADQ